MKKQLFFILLAICGLFVHAQENPGKDSLTAEEPKTGFNFGVLPAVAYDTDVGFRYGVLTNIYHYGDGSNYPDYNHSLYLEWSKTTKGNVTNTLKYDTRTLIPNTRLTAEVRYLTEKSMDFFGFNGAEAYYNADFRDENHDDYISRVYYGHNRKMLRTKADFQGKLFGSESFRWLLGGVFYNFAIGTVDIADLNEGKSEDEQLPDADLLYDRYVNWGIIPENQADGGNVAMLKGGLVYDTRDNEANPNSGIWSEVMFLTAPGFLGNDLSYTKLLLSHRQYFTLFPNRLTLAYRLSYQPKIAGEMPFYILPFYYDSYRVEDALGGAKTLRGIKRNRVVGEGFALGNVELRWKVARFQMINQNFYIALSSFLDAGMITDPWDFSIDGVTAGYGNTRQENINTLQYETEKPHYATGLGLHIAMNNNFIVAIDYGMALDEDDGTSGLYIGLDFIF